jgi:hypothetical protein
MRRGAPLALSDAQLRFVQQTASALPRSIRPWFVHSVSTRLATYLSDADAQAAVTQTLSGVGVAAPIFLCDAAATKEPDHGPQL